MCNHPSVAFAEAARSSHLREFSSVCSSISLAAARHQVVPCPYHFTELVLPLAPLLFACSFTSFTAARRTGQPVRIGKVLLLRRTTRAQRQTDKGKLHMKLYSSCPSASMSMHANERLKNLLRAVMREESFNIVIETGTYLGLGSTTFIAESFPANRPPSSFITIEANWSAWRKARKNLARFPFISPLWGKSVPTEEALLFIRTDEMLLSLWCYFFQYCHLTTTLYIYNLPS